MSKYKYYFKKPKSEIVKDVLTCLVAAGAICVAASSPYFVINFWKNYKRWKKYDKRKFYNAFYRLQKEGCLEITERNHQLYLSLTEKGKRKAGRFQIDSLEIKKPKKWDGKWRLVIFDISQPRKLYRELFRAKLKDLGFFPFQKSVWTHVFDCKDEIEFLKEFFGLTEKEVRLIVTQDIGDDNQLKRFFKIK